jgi:IS5 family transposase
MNGFERYTKKTRREVFLEEMEQVVPWRELCALIEPHYPKAGNGRPPVGVERMLRMYFLQQWFNLSDPAVEEALYDSPVMRQFVGIDLGQEPAPDETTVCKFRHLLEEHGLGEKILGRVNLHRQAGGVRITTGTIVDATILHAPASTKNREQQVPRCLYGVSCIVVLFQDNRHRCLAVCNLRLRIFLLMRTIVLANRR